MFEQLKQKYKELPKGVRTLICIVFILVVGLYLFEMGRNIGETLYHAVN